MLHAYICNAAGHNLRLYPPGHPFRTVLTQARSYHERKTLEAVANIMRTSPGAVSDGVLLALCIIIFQAGDYDETKQRYPESPMATAQSLKLYANMDLTPAKIQHIQRYSRLVEARGGLDGISHLGWVHAVILYVLVSPRTSNFRRLTFI